MAEHGTRSRRAPPWRLGLVVAGLLLALLLVWSLRDALDPLRRAEAQREAERTAQLDQQLATVDLFVSAFWRLAPALIGLPLAALGLYLVGAIAWRRWGDRTAIAAHYQVQAVRAANPVLPSLATIHYGSARTSAIAPAVLGPPEETLTIGPHLPTFGELLDQGRIGPHRPIMMGLDPATGQPFEGGPADLYSCGVGALPGAGKSYLLAFLLAQSVLQGARLIVCDLHAGHPQSLATMITPLSSAFMCDIADDDRSILAALRYAKSKLDARRAGQGGRWPIVVVIDEWTSTLRGTIGAELPPFLLDVAEQGRKFEVHAALSAQGWTKDATGGELRNRLRAQFVLRQRNEEARYQFGIPAAQLPRDLHTLAPGNGYLLTARGDLHKLVVPQLTSADMDRVGAMLAAINRPAPALLASPLASAPATVEASRKPGGSGLEAKIEVASTASESRVAIRPEAAQLLAEIQGGKSISEIAKARNGGSASGRSYQAQLETVNQLLREAITQGGNS